MPDGSANQSNVVADTTADRVLISDDFVYWGGSGPPLPKKFLSYGTQGISLCAGRGHKNNFPPALVQEVTAWIRSLNVNGYAGEPLDWRRTP